MAVIALPGGLIRDRVTRCVPTVALSLFPAPPRRPGRAAGPHQELVVRLTRPAVLGLVPLLTELPGVRGELYGRASAHCPRGTAAYSWTWERYDAGTSGRVGWLLAQGWETAATADHAKRHAYRMTMAFERRGAQWIPVLIHGSSPHQT